MSTIHAIFENGVFRPTQPVDLPERTEVQLELSSAPALPATEPSKRRFAPFTPIKVSGTPASELLLQDRR